MGQYLRAARSRNEPFVTSVSDLHFLLFLCNILDLNVDLPVVAAARPPLRARRRLAAVVVRRLAVAVGHLFLIWQVLCARIVDADGAAGDLDGFQMMINCYAGLE